MANFEDTFKNFLIIGLFVFSMIAFISIVQNDNNATEKITDNKLINNTYNTLRTDLNQSSATAKLQQKIFESENPLATFGYLILYSVLSAGKVFTSLVIGVFDLLIKLPLSIIGLDSVIVSVLGTILIVTIIIGLWILYKIGG